MARGVLLLNSEPVKLTRSVNVVLFFVILFKINCVLSIGIGERKIIKAVYKKEYSYEIDSNTEYIFDYEDNRAINPVRVFVSAEKVNRSHPLLIVAQQRKFITTWQLPVISRVEQPHKDFLFASRTLCPEGINNFLNYTSPELTGTEFNPEEVSNPSIVITTSAREKVYFTIKVAVVDNFFMKANQERRITVASAEPVFYYYNFYDPENEVQSKDAVIVKASSDSLTCMLLSIQNSSCPVHDTEIRIQFDSYYQIVSKKGGLVLMKEDYPHGFFIVLMVEPDDTECNKFDINFFARSSNAITKNVKISVNSAISKNEHKRIALITFGVYLLILLIIFVGGIIYVVLVAKRARKSRNREYPENGCLFCLQIWLLPFGERFGVSNNYVWILIIVLLFYMLPVLQLVFTYQDIVLFTGDDNICFYNFLCAMPYRWSKAQIRDFNHVLSNIGYVCFGFAFIFIAYIKAIRFAVDRRRGYGVMKPFGLFYSLGIALVMEGIMSASYHVCPKKSNFQFDTCFMHVLGVLTVICVYENRKMYQPQRVRDQRVYGIFLTLAGIMGISLIGSYVGMKDSYWLILNLIHMFATMCIIWRVDHVFLVSLFRKGFRHMDLITKVHLSFIIVVIIANFLLATLVFFIKYLFATHVLIVLIFNGYLYVAFYTLMKVLHKEKIYIRTIILTVMSAVFWISGVYFFVTLAASWELTPSESRNVNKECVLFNYFDVHDVWHFLSGIALFLTCVALITLDDGLSAIPTPLVADFHNEERSKIFNLKEISERQPQQEVEEEEDEEDEPEPVQQVPRQIPKEPTKEPGWFERIYIWIRDLFRGIFKD